MTTKLSSQFSDVMIGIRQSDLGYGIGVFLAVLTLLMAFPEWGTNLLSMKGFIPHGHCYLWKPGLVGLHVISDSLIALAYVAISGTLAYLVYKTRREIPFHWMFLAFGSFIIACGGTHFMDVLTLWYPTYWLAGALKAITALASVTTAATLPFLVPQALALVESAKLSEERRSHLETAIHRLAALNEQLKEMDQLKTRFFANVSHELRTPLALILGPTEKLLRDRELSPAHQRELELIDRNARLLLKQVNDLLDVSKLEAGEMTVNYTQTDLAQLVRLTAANFDGLAQDKQVTFTVDARDALVAQVDVTKIQRILLNLLSNAFKFTPDGGRIEVQVAQVGNEDEEKGGRDEELSTPALTSPSTPFSARIIVNDSGRGISPEFLPYIFERFSQGEGGTTRQFGGTGLGLAIAKEFVELHGGTISATNAPEGGAQFIVELPLVQSATLAPVDIQELEHAENIADLVVEELRTVAQAAPLSVDQETGKPLVLIVEDNPEMNQFITKTLAKEYRTATAHDGQAGLEQAIALQPDLILSDVMMPFLSGDQLVQQIRTYPELDTTPIIMLTAKADDDLRVQLLQQGAQDYLMKPFSVEELRARASNLIAIKRVRDLLQQELVSQNHDLEALVEEVGLRRRELQLALTALQHQAEELEQANRLRDEFLAIVSHELRTPLNSILGWAEALRTRQFNEKTTARALETIERNARLQTQLIENLLDVSRLLRGKVQLNKYPVSLQIVVDSAIKTVQSQAEAKSIQIKSDIAEGEGQVFGDGDRLRQVIENLLSNAIKFTPEGGKVDIQLNQQNGRATIQVSDTGQGIQSEALPYIFDYFRQADSSTTRRHGGLGLGLAIAQHLVGLHGGTIDVESKGEDQGATFTVVLPLISTSHAIATRLK